jgi:hypothetical protein
VAGRRRRRTHPLRAVRLDPSEAGYDAAALGCGASVVVVVVAAALGRGASVVVMGLPTQTIQLGW